MRGATELNEQLSSEGYSVFGESYESLKGDLEEQLQNYSEQVMYKFRLSYKENSWV